MKKEKKAIIICCVVIAVLVAISAGLYIAGNVYYSSERIYEQTWNIELPDGMKKEFEEKTDNSFHGDGIRYTKYSVKEAENSLSDFKSEKDATIESAISEYLSTINIASEHQPNWGHNYTWKHIEKYENHLYMIYDQQTNELFVLQIKI